MYIRELNVTSHQNHDNSCDPVRIIGIRVWKKSFLSVLKGGV